MPSATLLPEEKTIIRQAIGHECQIFTATIARLYCADTFGKWKLVATGAIAFMKDLRCNGAFFLRLVDLQGGRTIWEQELYRDFHYTQQRPFFHSFFTDSYTAGLSFADDNEAQAFYMKVSTRDTLRVQSKTSVQAKRSTKSPIAQSPVGSASPANLPKSVSTSGGISSSSTAPAAGGGKKKKFDKSAIGAPTDFRHVTHVGFDQKRGGFSTENLPAEWAKVFRQAGVTDEQLADENTSKFIFDFMKKYEPAGGSSAPPASRPTAPTPPALPPSAGSNSGTLSRRAAPPPPPARAPPATLSGGPSVTQAPRQAPPPPPARPPPPPSRTVAPPPPTPSRDLIPAVSSPVSPMTPPAGSSAPPPPPPPAPAMFQQPQQPATEEHRAAPPVKKPMGVPVNAPNNDFLASIRGAGLSSLKPAAEREISTSQDELSTSAGGGDVANALKMALASRQNAMISGDASDSEEGSDNDDDW